MNKLRRFRGTFWFFRISRTNKCTAHSCFYGRNLCFETCTIKFSETSGRVKVLTYRYIGNHFAVRHVSFLSASLYVLYTMSTTKRMLHTEVSEFQRSRKHVKGWPVSATVIVWIRWIGKLERRCGGIDCC